MVAFAVAGEVCCDWKKEKTFLEILKIAFGALLVIGLLLEIREAVVQDATVLELRSKQELRIVSEAERAKIIAFLKDKPKGPVRIATMNPVPEKVRVYTEQIYGLLLDAGYTVPKKMERFIDFIPDFLPDTSIGLFVWNPNIAPPQTEPLRKALSGICDKMSVQCYEWRPSDSRTVPFETNEVMVFVLNFR